MFDVLNDIVDKDNNIYYQTINMKPIDVKPSYAKYNIESNEKDPKFQVGDHIRISKNKSTFATVYALNWSEEAFVIRKSKRLLLEICVSDINGEKKK